MTSDIENDNFEDDVAEAVMSTTNSSKSSVKKTLVSCLFAVISFPILLPLIIIDMVFYLMLLFALVFTFHHHNMKRWTRRKLQKLNRSGSLKVFFLFHILSTSFVPCLQSCWKHTILITYGGTKQEQQKYMSTKLFYYFFQMFRSMYPYPYTLIGLYKAPGEPYSIILSLLHSTEEITEMMEKDSRWLQDIVSTIATKYDKVKKICFGGIIPSLLHSYDAWPVNPTFDDKLVKGAEGTLFMVLENISEAIHLHQEAIKKSHSSIRLDRKDNENLPVVVIIGLGFLGSKVCNKCIQQGGMIVRGIDKRDSVKANLDPRVNFFKDSDHEEALKDANVIVLLTKYGDESINAYFDQIKPGTIVISDTHPKITKKIVQKLSKAGIKVYESALTREGVNFIPKMPRWNNDTIPGCVGEGFVRAALPPFEYQEQNEFDRNARRIVKARLDVPDGAQDEK